MYRLVTFEATNISGFKSGLGRKSFRLDLRSLLDKDIIVILGDNATGKSTFLSLIHPMHTPSDKKQRFVVEGKEGVIVREYLGDDGSSIVTKAIYTPKKDEGHSAKLYFRLIRGDEETELNPNGNVSSYYTLVNTYFGVNKDYIQFASYNDVVKGIVKMTDSERKLSVSSLVPNTNRFETAYSIINDKYRDLNNTLRNLSQKIVHLGEEDALQRDLKRYDRELKEYKEKREKLIKKAARLEGQIKELSGGQSVKELRRSYQIANDRMIALTSGMLRQLHAIQHCCESLYPDNVSEENVIWIAEKQIRRLNPLEAKIHSAEEKIARLSEERSQIRTRVSSIDQQLNEYEASLFSLQNQSIEDLEDLQKSMREKLEDMEYPKVKDRYKNLSYEEGQRFCENLTIISAQLEVAYERFGELVSRWFRNELPDYETLLREIREQKSQLDQCRAQRDQSYQRIVEYNSHSGLREILAKRPTTCTDDSCPFIAKALEWDIIESKLKDEMETQERMTREIALVESRLEDNQLYLQAAQFLPSLYQTISQREGQFLKYFGLTLSDLMQDLAQGQIPTVFNLDQMKQHLAILSEKDLYEQIVKVTLPKIESEIRLIRSSEKNRDLIRKACSNLQTERDAYLDQMDQMQSSITTTTIMLESYRGKRDMILQVKDAIESYRLQDEEYQEISKDVAGKSSAMEKILEMSQEMDASVIEIDRLNERMREIAPVRDQTYYNLRQLCQLNLEKAVVDRDFLIISLMRRMVGPGKGIWKEAIDIYMQDINAIANELLLHMFNGNLSLNDFVIDDKHFVIPYTFNGNESPDISYASSSQQTTISNAISLAIISKLLDRYGILTFDEVDKDLSPINKEIFVKILATQMRYIGIQQCFVITHNPDYYESYYPGYICFPGGKPPTDADAITV